MSPDLHYRAGHRCLDVAHTSRRHSEASEPQPARAGADESSENGLLPHMVLVA
jgi:hypothetical protein